MARVNSPEGDSASMQSDGLMVYRIRELEQLAPLREWWNELLVGSDTRTVELSYEWQTTYWKHFHDSDDLFVLVAEDAGRIAGIAPLKRQIIRVNGVALRRLCFIAASESNYQDILTDDRSGKVHARFWQFLQDHREEWDRLDLESVPTASMTIGCFSGERIGNAPYSLRKRTRCLHLTINCPWDEYFASRSRKTREHCRNRLKKLGDFGPVRLSRVTDDQEIEQVLERLFAFHRARWNPTTTPSKFNDERMRSFYHECMLSLGKLGLMCLYVLTAGTVTVAVEVVFHIGGTYLDQINSYNTELEKLGPSVLLKRLFLEDLFKQGFATVDFGTWYEYKRVWAEEESEKVSFEVYAGRSLRHLYCYSTTALLMGARESLKRVTLLRAAIQRLRQATLRQRNDVEPDASPGSE